MMYLVGGNNMWPFKKKQAEPLELPFLEMSNEPAKDVVLYSDDKSEARENIIPLPEKTVVENEPVQATISQKKGDVFIKTETHKAIIETINDVSYDLENVNKDVTRISSIKENRYERINDLQSSFDDISKKLMIVDQTLFGG